MEPLTYPLLGYLIRLEGSEVVDHVLALAFLQLAVGLELCVRNNVVGLNGDL